MDLPAFFAWLDESQTRSGLFVGLVVGAPALILTVISIAVGHANNKRPSLRWVLDLFKSLSRVIKRLFSIRLTTVEQRQRSKRASEERIRMVLDDAEEMRTEMNQLLKEAEARTAMQANSAKTLSLQLAEVKNELLARKGEVSGIAVSHSKTEQERRELKFQLSQRDAQLQAANAQIEMMQQELDERPDPSAIAEIRQLQDALHVLTGGRYAEAMEDFDTLDPTAEQLKAWATEVIQPKATVPAFPVAPRWRISKVAGFDTDYHLKNSVAGSVAFNVRIEEHRGSFDFTDGAHWPDLSGVEVGTFHGRPQGDAADDGIWFDVQWYDGDRTFHNEIHHHDLNRAWG
jgi:energy-converting hydrogenase A subunit M